MSTDVRQQYLAQEIFAAPPQRRHLMLLEAAIRQSLAALTRLEAGDTENGLPPLSRARQLLAELLAGLKPELAPELVHRTGMLYLWAYKRLALAGLQNNPQHVRDAIRVLQEERETWKQVCAVLASDAAPPLANVAEGFPLTAPVDQLA